MTIKDLKPQNVWSIFEQITKVPRPSGHLDKIREWLVNFAKENNLEYKVDNVGNVAIFRPAAPGFENAKGVVLQGHMDMVAEKAATSNHNFLTDPIETIVDGEWLKANNTTLGADDGIGVAMALAVLTDKDLKCGPLEALVTVDEETGLTGALGMTKEMLQGSYLLNLDSEDDGIITMGCAGGVVSCITLDYTPQEVPADLTYFEIKIGKLHGGHSGSDIHLGYACATKQIARLLYRLGKEIDFELASINAGNLHNAIAHEGTAVVGVKAADKEKLAVIVNQFKADVEGEYKNIEKEIEITCHSTDKPAQIIDKDTATRVIEALFAAPHGVSAMCHDIDDLVQTSTNLACVKTLADKKEIYIEQFTRSSIESQKFELAHQIEATYKLAGAREVREEGSYQGWEPNLDNHILKVAVESWEKLYGVKPIVNAIHAGLECGLFMKVRPDMDMISYGPTLQNVHSPKERCHIPAVQKAWDFTIDILKQVAAGK